MKITLTVELDLPDDMVAWSDAELRQMLFDSYTNYVPLQHLNESLHWMCESVEDSSAQLIADIHTKWYYITKDPPWSFKRN